MPWIILFRSALRFGYKLSLILKSKKEEKCLSLNLYNSTYLFKDRRQRWVKAEGI